MPNFNVLLGYAISSDIHVKNVIMALHELFEQNKIVPFIYDERYRAVTETKFQRTLYDLNQVCKNMFSPDGFGSGLDEHYFEECFEDEIDYEDFDGKKCYMELDEFLEAVGEIGPFYVNCMETCVYFDTMKSLHDIYGKPSTNFGFLGIVVTPFECQTISYPDILNDLVQGKPVPHVDNLRMIAKKVFKIPRPSGILEPKIYFEY